MIEHKQVNFEDSRGTIRDIFQKSPKDHCTIITSNKSAIRGNHYHKLTTQYTYVVEGEMEMLTQELNEDGTPKGAIQTVRLKPGDLAAHPPFEAHAFKAITNTVMLAFADGVRGGDNYEKDTFRLERPLILS